MVCLTLKSKSLEGFVMFMDITQVSRKFSLFGWTKTRRFHFQNLQRDTFFLDGGDKKIRCSVVKVTLTFILRCTIHFSFDRRDSNTKKGF